MSALAYQSVEKVPGNTRTQPATNGGYPGPGVQVPSMFNLGPFGTGCFLASFVKYPFRSLNQTYRQTCTYTRKYLFLWDTYRYTCTFSFMLHHIHTAHNHTYVNTNETASSTYRLQH